MIKNIKYDELFQEALEFHKKDQIEKAEEIYLSILNANPSHSNSLNNLGLIYVANGKSEKAEDYFIKSIKNDTKNIVAYFNLGNLYLSNKQYQESVIQYSKLLKLNTKHIQAYNNLGIALHNLNNSEKAKKCFENIIKLDPKNYEAYYNIGKILNDEEKHEEAIKYFKKTITLEPKHSNALNNLGIAYNKLSLTDKAKENIEKSIEIDPKNPFSYNNLGIVYDNIYDTKKARENFNKALQINPNFIEALWNLQCCSKTIDEALKIFERINKIDQNHIKSKIMYSALRGYKNDFKDYQKLISSKDSNHPYTRSIEWLFSLKKLPNLFFNKWDFFDYSINLSDKGRPFYEYGVRLGHSFNYLIKSFKKGYGFDTFIGLPEDWHKSKKKGSYSSFGMIPDIKGGEFIVGKFEDTLPIFFSKNRELASIINFDADLYSSTVCSLENSRKIIDNKTILIFDEFLMNTNWEKDEFRALNEFSKNYEVLAVSLFTKQVAVRIV